MKVAGWIGAMLHDEGVMVVFWLCLNVTVILWMLQYVWNDDSGKFS